MLTGSDAGRTLREPMLFDDRVFALVTRKYGFVQQATDDHVLFEALRFVRWLFDDPRTRPHAMQILQSDDVERSAYQAHLRGVLAEARRLRLRLAEVFPATVGGDASATDGFHNRLARFDLVAENGRSEDAEEADLEREPGRDSSSAKSLTRILVACARELAQREPASESAELLEEIDALRERHEFRFAGRSARVRTSPAAAFRSVLYALRSMAPPPAGTLDWMDFLPRNDARIVALQRDLLDPGRASNALRGRALSELRRDLGRVDEEILAALGGSLSTEAIVLRFKERCAWYDRGRMRTVAADDASGGTREDRLTLEVARYIHDNGVFALVRPRGPSREPEPMAPPPGARKLALESKVYDASGDPLLAVKTGFRQLHGYLSSLERAAVRAEEGYLVVFRLGGPICETPATVATERFLVHVLTIDLAPAPARGQASPQILGLTREALAAAVAQSELETPG